MKRAKIARTSDGMRKEYDFTGGVRGKYLSRFTDGANVVILAPDVAHSFPNSKAVNHALRLLIKLARVSRAESRRGSRRNGLKLA